MHCHYSRDEQLLCRGRAGAVSNFVIPCLSMDRVANIHDHGPYHTDSYHCDNCV